MKFQIKNRWTASVIFECEAESLKLAVMAAVSEGVSLRDSDLSGCNLRGCDLRDSDLSGCNLRGCNLRGCNLRGCDLRGCNLRDSKHDLWAVLLHAKREVTGLVTALNEGRVNGDVYEGACACLVGTLANVRGCKYDAMAGLPPRASRPAERWFTGISEGDTPENSPIVALTLEWIAEFQKLVAA